MIKKFFKSAPRPSEQLKLRLSKQLKLINAQTDMLCKLKAQHEQTRHQHAQDVQALEQQLNYFRSCLHDLGLDPDVLHAGKADWLRVRKMLRVSVEDGLNLERQQFSNQFQISAARAFLSKLLR